MTIAAPARTRRAPATRPAPSRSGATSSRAPRPQPGQVRRQAPAPKLKVVPKRRAHRASQKSLLKIAAAGIVAFAFVVVAYGQSVVAQGQVDLAVTQSRVQSAETLHRQAVLSVAKLETPTRVASTAVSTLHLVQPRSVIDLAQVPLNVVIAAPNITPAPPGSPAPFILPPIVPIAGGGSAKR
jgi:cell division protein FtsL